MFIVLSSIAHVVSPFFLTFLRNVDEIGRCLYWSIYRGLHLDFPILPLKNYLQLSAEDLQNHPSDFPLLVEWTPYARLPGNFLPSPYDGQVALKHALTSLISQEKSGMIVGAEDANNERHRDSRYNLLSLSNVR
ncbi:hypothetical protein EPI10_014093 [Gossypium australe]|uniref:Uncharacterized protein n=1 Tax=Gossypium australe TaxID=47621 RepID=A0A5B6UNK6_9ROSI|nr:hypothetical protein EPI10_014093 [Gossypium australe]